MMGSNEGLPLEQPVHQVSIESPFWIMTHLVTQELWLQFSTDNPSKFINSDKLPVDSVSYDAAVSFCHCINERYGYQLRLPGEAQWEYACRAGTSSEYFWGASNKDAIKYGWFDLNSLEQTHPVARLAPNPWGIYDIVGNVWEWCDDVWHSDYHNAPETDETWMTNVERQPRRCLRGGAWDMDVFRLRSAYRSYDHRELGIAAFGLRLIMPD